MRILVAGACLVLGCAWLRAQGSAGIVRGQVTDPSGRVVPGASIDVVQGQLVVQTAHTDSQGRYEVRNLTPGGYTVRATAAGFAEHDVAAYEVRAGGIQVLDFPLTLAVKSEQITVSDVGKVDLNPDSNSSALVLRGKDLDALPDDPDDLAADLQALAGPAAGPNGGQIYIDGFTGGRLPPKSSIREVRVNQNPFAAQFDRLGYGRVEIFTKPGSESFHGELLFQYGNDVFNARNPFSPVKPPYERRHWEGEVNGPLGKKTSYSADFEIRRITENAFINALTLAPDFQVVSVSQGVVTPLAGTEENLRLDRQLTANHTLTARYMYARDTQDNQGVGGFSLASRAYQNHDAENNFQASETGIFGPHLMNETRARYWRVRGRQSGQVGLPTISVLDAFAGGGPPLSLSFSNQDRYEVQNLTSLTRGAHVVRWGGRLRTVTLNDRDSQNYTGTYTFSSLDSYRLTLLGVQSGLSPQQIRASGGGAGQFSIAGGNPQAQVSQLDVGLFGQDDWRVRPNATLSLGLRYEAQTNLGDHRDVAPRVGLAWALGTRSKTPKTVIRAGAGVFYERVSESLTLTAIRLDGLHQQQFVVSLPDFFPAIPSPAALAGAQVPQAIRRVDGGMAAPRVLQAAIGVERQLPLPKNTVVTINYVHTRGLEQLRSRNVGGAGEAVYLYEASGRFRQQQLVTSLNARVSPRFTLSASYTLSRAKSDTDGAGTFPADSNNLKPEYGRAGFDIRHRVQLNGSIAARWGLRFSPLLVATSGRPFNITLGRDVNGDTLFTDRPVFATDPAAPGVVSTPYGVFDTVPQPGQTIISRNFGNGPSQLTFNLRLTKTITLWEPDKPGGGDSSGREPCELIFSVMARNLLNHPNLSLPVGNLSSPLFGESTAALGSRRLDLQVRLSF